MYCFVNGFALVSASLVAAVCQDFIVFRILKLHLLMILFYQNQFCGRISMRGSRYLNRWCNW